MTQIQKLRRAKEIAAEQDSLKDGTDEGLREIDDEGYWKLLLAIFDDDEDAAVECVERFAANRRAETAILN